MPLSQIEPYYTAGSATFVTGGAVVTGVGTAWLTNVEPGDQFFNRLGQKAPPVLTVDSNTQVTLRRPFRGTAQAADEYEVYRVPDSVRLENFSQRMVNMLAGNNLVAEAAIDGTDGNWLSYFTGAGAKARTAFTAKARSLLGLADETAMRNWLDVAQKQGDQFDTNLGRGMIVGAFGLGQEFGQSISDCNTAIVNGTYTVFSGVNSPASSGLLAVKSRNDTNSKWQTYYAFGTNNVYQRYWNGTSWGSWILVYGPAAILGIVSQSGGSPTGSILEYGSNANGSYIRYADGTQMAWHVGTPSAGAFAWTYPAAYASSPKVQATVNFATDARIATIGTQGLTSATVHVWLTSGSTSNLPVNVLATGRWF